MAKHDPDRERRNDPRLAGDWPCVAILSGRHVDGVVTDLSRTGARLEGPYDAAGAEAGATGALQISVLRRVLACAVKVRWARATPVAALGLEFTHMTAGVQVELQEALWSELRGTWPRHGVVLLVGLDPALRKRIAAALERHRWPAVLAGTPLEALRALDDAQLPVTALVTTATLTSCSGPRFLEHIANTVPEARRILVGPTLADDDLERLVERLDAAAPPD